MAITTEITRVHTKTLLEIAGKLIGIKYQHLGRLAHLGVDCWGLIFLFYRELGILLRDPLCHYKVDWFKDQDHIQEQIDGEFGQDFVKVKHPGIGDIISLRTQQSEIIDHLGLMLSDGFLLHTDRFAGAHKIKLYAVQPKVAGYYHYRNLQVLP